MERLSRQGSLGVFKRKSIEFVYFAHSRLLGLAAWQAWLHDNILPGSFIIR